MFRLASLFHHAARGISSTWSMVIAILIVLICWRIIIVPLLGALVGLLKIVVELGVLVLMVLIIAYFIRTLSKKVS